MRREFDLPITAITGPATDNEVGQVYITTGLGLPAHNARRDAPGCWRSVRGALAELGGEHGGADVANGDAAPAPPEPSRAPGAAGAMKVAVIGSAGYAGGELLRLLLQHPRSRSAWPPAGARRGSRSGRCIRRWRPSRTRASRAPRRARRRAGATWSSSASSTASRRGWRARCSTRARASSWTWPPTSACAIPASTSATTAPHTAPDLLPRFTYGLADVVGCRLRGATAIAAPGLLRHRGAARALPAGVGGTGRDAVAVRRHRLERRRRAARPTTHHPMRAHNLFAYSALSHRHEAEVLASWREWVGRPDATARLMTTRAVRARHLSDPARLSPKDAASRDGEPGTLAARLVSRGLRGPAVRPRARCAARADPCRRNQLRADPRRRERNGQEIQVTVAIDNLVKGAGGQAIQAMNLALGIDERAGLTSAGIYPC